MTIQENEKQEYTKIFGKGNQKISSDVFTYSHTMIKGCSKNCKDCKGTCYAVQRYKQYKNVRRKWDSNLALSKTKEFYNRFVNEIIKRKINIVRLFQSGDVYNKSFLNRLYKSIQDTPNTKYWGYTKNHDAMKLNELPNCNMIYSYINGFRNYGTQEYCNLLKQKFNAHICTLDEKAGEKCGNHCKYCLDKTHDKVCFVIHGSRKNKDDYESKVIEQLRALPDYVG